MRPRYISACVSSTLFFFLKISHFIDTQFYAVLRLILRINLFFPKFFEHYARKCFFFNLFSIGKY